MEIQGVHRILLIALLFASSTSSAQFNIFEPFTGSEQVSGAYEFGDQALLTASTAIDDEGDGWLRLTSATGNQKGYVFLNRSFPSTLGVSVDFEYKIWTDKDATQADGFSVFLFDADVSTDDFRIGGFGGSLGYANKNAVKGLSGGYIGVGFDVYGNFSNTSDNKDAEWSEQKPNAIVLRGPTTDNFSTTNKHLETVKAPQGTPIHYTTVTNRRPTDNTFYRRVRIEIIATDDLRQKISVRWKTSEEGAFTELLTYTTKENFPVALPQKLKLGFAASTGSSYSTHEIRNVRATTPGNLIVENSTGTEQLRAGHVEEDQDKFTYTIKVENDTDAKLTDINFSDFFVDSNGDRIPEGMVEITEIAWEGFIDDDLPSPTAEEPIVSGEFSATLGLEANSFGTITVVGRLLDIPAGYELKNSAEISSESILENDTSNNFSAATIPVLAGDILVTKSSKLSEIRASSTRDNESTFEYEILVENLSKINLSEIEVEDIFKNADNISLPAGVVEITEILTEGFTTVIGLPAFPTQSSGFNATVGLDAGEEGKMTVKGYLLQIPTGGELDNTVNVSSLEIEDVNLLNNHANVSLPVKSEGVDLTVELDAASACLESSEEGTRIEFFVTNNGTADANYEYNDLKVIIEYPEGVEFRTTETNASEWSYTNDANNRILTVERKKNKGGGYIAKNGGKGPAFPFYLGSGESYIFNAKVSLTSADGTSAEPEENLEDNDVDLFVGVRPEAPVFDDDTFILFQGTEETLMEDPEGGNSLWWRSDVGEENSGSFVPDTTTPGTFVYDVYWKTFTCPGESTPVTVIVVPAPSPGEIGAGETEICKGSSAQVQSSEEGGEAVETDGYQTTLSYRWEFFSPSSSTWEVVTGEDAPTLQSAAIYEDARFRRFTISTLSDLDTSSGTLGEVTVLESGPTSEVAFTVKNCYIMVNPALPSNIK